MFRTKFKVLVTLFSIFSMFGCGGSSSSAEKRFSLNEDNIISTAEREVKLDDTLISDGMLIDDVTISATDESGIKLVETTIPAGTKFSDEEENIVVDTAPIISLVTQESKDEDVEDGKKTIDGVVQTKLKLVGEDGRKLVPSNPIEVAIKAPNGAKPGDKIEIDMPDGVTIKAKGDKQQEKLIVVVVGADGNVHIVVAPQVFKNMTVIVIVIRRRVTIPITGGSGGN